MAAKELVEYLIRMTSETTSAESGIGRVAAEAGKMTAGVGAAAAAFTAAGVAAVAMANDITGGIDRINTMAASTGLAAKEVAALEAAAQAAGKPVEAVIPKDLAKRIYEVSQGTGEAKDAWQALGVSATDANGNLRSSSDVFRDLIDKLGAVEDTTTRAALAEKALGGEARELTQVLSDSRALDAWVGYTERYVDVGPEAQRVTAKWQQSMAIWNQGVMAMKGSILPLIDIMANTVIGLTAMGVAASAWVKAVLSFEDPIAAAYTATSDWVASVQELNSSLAKTSDRIDDATAAAERLAKTDAFQFGDVALNASLIGVTGRKGSGKPPVDDGGGSGGSGSKTRAKRWDDDINVSKLEKSQEALGAELAANRVALTASTTSTDAAQTALDKLGQAIQLEATARQTGASAENVAAQSSAMSSALSPVALIAGSVVDAVGIIGSAANMVDSVAVAIETLPEQLMMLPDAVVHLIDALAGLVPALIEASPEIALAIGDAMLSTALASVEVIAQTVASAFEALPGDIAAAIADALRNLTGNLNPFDGDGKFGFGLAERIPFFEDGGRVNATGLAVVHAGETVVPAADRVAGGPMLGSPTVNVYTTDARIAAREVSAAIGPYGIGARLGGVR